MAQINFHDVWKKYSYMNALSSLSQNYGEVSSVGVTATQTKNVEAPLQEFAHKNINK